MISPVKIWRRQKEIRKHIHKMGVVLSWTRVYTPPVGFKKNAPYYVVLVQFTSGEKSFGQMVDPGKSEIQIGMRVISVLRKVREVEAEDVIAYGLKFKPYSK